MNEIQENIFQYKDEQNLEQLFQIMHALNIANNKAAQVKDLPPPKWSLQ